MNKNEKKQLALTKKQIDRRFRWSLLQTWCSHVHRGMPTAPTIKNRVTLLRKLKDVKTDQIELARN